MNKKYCKDCLYGKPVFNIGADGVYFGGQNEMRIVFYPIHLANLRRK